MLRGEYKADQFVNEIAWRPVCCDESVSMGKRNRHFRRLITSGGDKLESEHSLASALGQASDMFCDKAGSETRHLEGLFSIMRMLGLILVYA